jgi:DnaJ-class molecular chaperone
MQTKSKEIYEKLRVKNAFGDPELLAAMRAESKKVCGSCEGSGVCKRCSGTGEIKLKKNARHRS